MSEICVKGQIFKEGKPDLKFFTLDGFEIEVSDVILSKSGKILSVTDTSGTEFFREEFFVCNEFLTVPGVGHLKPGSLVRIEGQTYELLYGPHINISNQNLISWYLRPREVCATPDPLGRVTSEDRTLYLEMIDKIDLVTV